MQELQVIKIKGQRVLLTRQLAEAYGTERQIISNNYTRNKSRYIVGKHVIILEGDSLREFKASHQIDDNLKYAHNLYLWTEKGALLHAKSLNTDKAWEVYDYLVDFYFRAKEEQEKKEIVPTEESVRPVPDMIEKKKQNVAAGSFGSIRPVKGLVVNVPENKEAQDMILKARKYLTGMDALLDIYSMYNGEDDYKKICDTLRQMQSRISWATSRLCSINPRLVEKYL